MRKYDSMRSVMTMKRLFGLSIGMLSVMLAACSSAGSSGKDVVSDQEVRSKDPVKLVLYSDSTWSQEAFNERFGDAMRKKFPEYNIEYIASGKGSMFADHVVAGTPIDIYWQAVDNAIPRLLEYGLQYDMTDLINKHKIDLSTLEPTSIKTIKEMSDGKMYALPLVINTAAMYYNKDVFDKFGISYPQDGMTWDQVIELAKRFNIIDNGQQYYGIASAITPHVSLNGLSIPYIDTKTGKPTIQTDDGWKTIFNQLISMRKTTNNKALGEDNFVKDGNIAMLDYLANTFLNKDMSAMNWDMVTYPTFKETPNRGPQTLPTLFGITSISKHKDEAMKVLKYMLSEEVQLSLSEKAVIPVLQSETVTKSFGKNSIYKNKNFQAILKQKFAPITPKTKFEAQVRTIYNKPLSDLVKGTIDLNTAFRQIDEEMNQMIAADKAK